MVYTMFGLTAPEFFALVKQHFHFLLDDYGFSVIKEENTPAHSSRAVVLQKDDLCIEVSHEQLSVGLFLFPCSEGKIKGVRIVEVVTFIDRDAGKLTDSEESFEGRFYPKIDQALDDRTKIMVGLDWYANYLRPYLDRVLLLFQKETFKRREAELEEWKRLWQKQIWKNFSQWLQENQRR